MEILKKDIYIYIYIYIVHNVLTGIKEDFSFSLSCPRGFIGNSLSYLNQNKTIPIINFCGNVALIYLDRFRNMGINCSMCIISRKGTVTPTFHFIAKVAVSGIVYYIGAKNGNIYGIDCIPESEIIISEKRYNGENSIEEIFSKEKLILIGLNFKELLFKILPRQWNIRHNRNKDIYYLQRLSEIWKEPINLNQPLIPKSNPRRRF